MTTVCGDGNARRVRGFTLIELVIAVAIVGVLAMMTLPMLQVAAQRQKETELRSALREIRSAIDAYHQAARDKKIQVPADASGYPPTLEDLVRGVPDVSRPDHRPIRFLRRLPRDPMHPDASVPAAATWGTRDYRSAHDDPWAGEDVYDVYSLSPRVGLNGIPYREW